MKKRWICALLAVVLLLSVAPAVSLEAKAASNMKASQELIEMLKKFEGFLQYPKWDYKQYSMGYGTVCYEHELAYYQEHGITHEEAEERLKLHVNNFSAVINRFIDRYNLTMTQQQFDAMVSLSYNCGTSWERETTGYLHNALKNGSVGNDLIYAFSLWSYTNDVPHDGHLKRRLAEANLYLNNVYSTSKPENYTYIRFDPNGGTMDYTIQGYDANVDAPIKVIIEPTYTAVENGEKKVYTFDGWYTARAGGQKITILDGSLALGTTLYARWKDSDGSLVEPEGPAGEPMESITVTVTGNNINVRQGPGTSYNVVGYAVSGQELTITEIVKADGYTWGKFGTGLWISLHYTNYDALIQEQNPPVQTGTVKVNGSLNIRSGAGTSYPVVGSYTNGNRVTILEKKTVGATVWGRTNRGWISLDYVELDPVEDTPVTPPSSETVPPTTESVPPTTESVPPTTESVPPTTETVPPTTETIPPTTETTPPTTQKPPTKPAEPVLWTGTVKVSDYLHIRKGPGTYHPIAGYYVNGTKVGILEEQESGGLKWGRTDKGWICLKYVDDGKTPVEPPKPPVTEPPVTEPPVVEPQPSEPDKPDVEQPATKWTGKVTVKDILYVRKTPGASGAVIGNLVNGATVTITQRTRADGKLWGKVDKGWICLDYVTADSESSPATPNVPEIVTPETGSTVLEESATMEVSSCSLRIRNAAGVTGDIVGYYAFGEEVAITEISTIGTTTWAKTDLGWVNMRYLK